ncbi:MAG: cell division protein FtsQ/DivIB [Bacteroidia bacterium]
MNPSSPNKKRNRTFAEIEQEKAELEQKSEAKTEKKQKRPTQSPKFQLFPKIRLKSSVKYAIACIILLVLLGTVNSYQRNLICKKLDLKIISKEDNAFLNEAQIRKMIEEDYKRPVLGEKMSHIDMHAVEVALKKSPYIENAQVYRSFSSDLKLEIALREPIARIIDGDGTNMYVDKNGKKFPTVNRHASHVPIIRGTFDEILTPADSFACDLVERSLPVAKFVYNHPFWNAQISEIYIQQSGDLRFYPQIGNMYIEFGDSKRIEEKFDNLKLFYDQVIKQIGWGRYKGVSVKYRGQIVGIK